jgi:hypothetical protein
VLHREPMLALAYDYQDFDDDDDEDDDDDDDDGRSLDTTSEFAIMAGGTRPPPAANHSKTMGSSSTPYPAPSASPPRKSAGGGGSGRCVLYFMIGVEYDSSSFERGSRSVMLCCYPHAMFDDLTSLSLTHSLFIL